MITKPVLTAFRADFAEAVKQLGSKYNMKINLTSITYNPTSFKGRLVVTSLDESGVPVMDAEDFALSARLLGVPTEWLNKEFMTPRGEKLRIIGLSLNRPKNAVELMGVGNGNIYRASVAYVRQFVK
jgi:hypothetical protein